LLWMDVWMDGFSGPWTISCEPRRVYVWSRRFSLFIDFILGAFGNSHCQECVSHHFYLFYFCHLLIWC
jgi:hypothetical protein